MKNIHFLIALFLLISTFCYCETPTKWRGGTDGVYIEEGLMKQWPAEGPEVLWAYEELGKGHSSPSFANDKIYITGMLDTIGNLFVLDQSGRLVYKIEYGTEWYKNFHGTRSTPVVVGNLVYVYSGQGAIICIDDTKQEIKWSIDILKKYSAKNISWGVTETPIVDGDIIYCTPGGEHTVVALNRFTSEQVWTSKAKGDVSAYCTPRLIQLENQKIIVSHTDSYIIAINAETGKLLWTYDQPNKWSVHANTPIYHDGSVYCFSGYGKGGVKISIDENGNKTKVDWVDIKLDSRMGGVVLIDGYLYGSGDKNRNWYCLDWETGAVQYENDTIGKGVVISDGEMLYCYSEKGELALAKVNPKKFELISKTKVTMGTAQHWAHPVINNGRLFVRHGNALIAYKIK
ncbi:PQQ-binding-like beta-propeller repeat protein [Bacteroidales bacterium]|nr:PQQ-binding-like beta-propeller repeat protein [Bacteroidales bacterium]